MKHESYSNEFVNDTNDFLRAFVDFFERDLKELTKIEHELKVQFDKIEKEVKKTFLYIKKIVVSPVGKVKENYEKVLKNELQMILHFTYNFLAKCWFYLKKHPSEKHKSNLDELKKVYMDYTSKHLD